HTKNKHRYIQISVASSDVPISYHGVYYYRSGATKQELKGASLQQFILKKFGKSWDDMIVENATLKDIDEKAVLRFIKKALDNKRISPDAANDGIEPLLRNMHLINEKGKLK